MGTESMVCEICKQRIEADEAHVVIEAEHGEGEHTACARDWFRRNFGREGLC